jgi:VanZ family protein
MLKKSLKPWLSVFLWMGLIFIFSSIPNLKSGFDEDITLRKLAHVFEYFVLTALLFRALNKTFSHHVLNNYAYASFLSVLYAASDEFHQTFVQGRNGCTRDVLIDSIGILIFYGVMFFKYRRQE